MLSSDLVDAAVDRAADRRRVRAALGLPADRKISDEVIDGLLAGASSEKRQRRFVGFDDKILALYSRGLSVRDIPRTSPRSTA